MKRVVNQLPSRHVALLLALFALGCPSLVACMNQGAAPGAGAQGSTASSANPVPAANSTVGSSVIGTSVGSNAPVEGLPPASDATLHDGPPGLLSAEWAKQRPAASAADKQRAKVLRDQAYALYKQKKDGEAVPLYQQALQLEVSGQLYYEYANSLSNVDRLPDSIKAYQVAIVVGYAHPEIALYNTACAQSRMKDAAAAFASLDQAVSKGYAATAKMQSDSDLSFLRQQPEWPKRFAEYQQSPNALVGVVVQFDYRTNDVYTVCPNGTIESQSSGGLDESCCKSRSLGKLTRKDGAFKVNWLKRCGRKGTGGRQNEGMMEVCQPYKGCTASEECSPIDKNAVLLDAQTAKKLIASAPKKDGEPGEWSHESFGGPVPSVCDEKF